VDGRHGVTGAVQDHFGKDAALVFVGQALPQPAIDCESAREDSQFWW
jgi:hypothetical protein